MKSETKEEQQSSVYIKNVYMSYKRRSLLGVIQIGDIDVHSSSRSHIKNKNQYHSNEKAAALLNLVVMINDSRIYLAK